jgi:hypothetical protein
MRWVLSFLLLLCCLGTASAEPEFTCTITSSRTTYVVGEVTDLAFRVINRSAEDVVLVGSLDGSDGRRYPKCVLEIVDAAGRSMVGPYVVCGNMNPLSPLDFRLVPAGTGFDPFGEGFFSSPALARLLITQPGEYTFRFHYATSSRIQDYFGDEGRDSLYVATPDIQQLFARVPKVDLVSELRLTFTPKSE